MIFNLIVLFVGIVMGFCFDWEIMQYVVQKFEVLGVLFEVKVVFVYWMLDVLFSYVEQVGLCGLCVIIVGVGGVVYLLGMIVVKIVVLVLGVLVQFKVFNGMDLLLLIVQMLVGILVVIFVIGNVGVFNVVLFVVVMLVSDQLVIGQVLDVFCVCQIEDVMVYDDLC